MFRFFLRLYFFVHGKTMILHAMVSTKKSNAYNIRFFSLKPLYCKKLFLSENFLLKMASVKLATVTLSRSPNIREKLNCVLEETNRHSNTAIKIVGDVNETIGHTPDGLSKVVAPALKKKKNSCFQLRLKWLKIIVMQRRKMDVRRRNRSSMHLLILWSQKVQSWI